MSLNRGPLWRRISGYIENISGDIKLGDTAYIDDTNNRVGIGTEAPIAVLDVAGTLGVTGTTTLNAVTYTWPPAVAGAGGYALTSTTGGGGYQNSGLSISPRNANGGTTRHRTRHPELNLTSIRLFIYPPLILRLH